MKKLILLAAVASLTVMTVRAQEVYKDGSAIVLDLSVAAGMPSGVVTTTKKYVGFTPYANVLGTDNDHNGAINATVYHKLEVAPADINTAGGTTGGTMQMTWVTAFYACKNATINGTTGWRLPTQRELMNIWIFRDAIVALGGTTFTAFNYWSATENIASDAWYVNFSSGYTFINNKTPSYSVRCVREL